MTKTVETEFCGMMAGKGQNGLGVAIVTMRFNRSNGSLAPVALEMSRLDLERLVEAAVFLLDNSKSLNTKSTLKASSRVNLEELPSRDDPVYQAPSS